MANAWVECAPSALYACSTTRAWPGLASVGVQVSKPVAGSTVMPLGPRASTNGNWAAAGAGATIWYVYAWPTVACVEGSESKIGGAVGDGTAVTLLSKMTRRPSWLRTVTV